MWSFGVCRPGRMLKIFFSCCHRERGCTLFFRIPNYSLQEGVSIKILSKIKILIIKYDYQDFSVIRLGLEPRTPTLKVLCSTS